MSEIVDTIEYKGYTIKIYADDDPIDPRNWDNLGKMICFHNRYDLGDKHDCRSSDFEGWDEIRDYLTKEYGAAIICPLYLYDHSGVSIKIGSFQGLLPQGHAEFDSGCVGFIYANEEMILKEFGGKKVTKYKLKKAIEILEGEVEIYNDYISGACYGYAIDDPEGNEIDDSCWGFYGYEWEKNGLEETAENAIDCEILDRDYKLEGERLHKVRKAKALIRNRVPLERRWA